MKKILMTFAILIVAATASFAQIGVRIGMDLSKFTGDLSDTYKTGVGLHLGAVYNFELADALSLQPGAFYVQRNWKTKVGDSKVHSHFIQVPVVLKYNIDITSDISIDPHIGPYFDFGFAGKNKDTDEKVFSKNGLDMKNFDMGLQFGVGAKFYDVAYVGFDYEIGFRDQLDIKNPVKPDEKLHARNSMFMITFGVYLPD